MNNVSYGHKYFENFGNIMDNAKRKEKTQFEWKQLLKIYENEQYLWAMAVKSQCIYGKCLVFLNHCSVREFSEIPKLFCGTFEKNCLFRSLRSMAKIFCIIFQNRSPNIHISYMSAPIINGLFLGIFSFYQKFP